MKDMVEALANEGKRKILLQLFGEGDGGGSDGGNGGGREAGQDEKRRESRL